jgi:hypothetical protein
MRRFSPFHSGTGRMSLSAPVTAVLRRKSRIADPRALPRDASGTGRSRRPPPFSACCLWRRSTAWRVSTTPGGRSTRSLRSRLPLCAPLSGTESTTTTGLAKGRFPDSANSRAGSEDYLCRTRSQRLLDSSRSGRSPADACRLPLADAAPEAVSYSRRRRAKH